MASPIAPLRPRPRPCLHHLLPLLAFLLLHARPPACAAIDVPDSAAAGHAAFLDATTATASRFTALPPDVRRRTCPGVAGATQDAADAPYRKIASVSPALFDALAALDGGAGGCGRCLEVRCRAAAGGGVGGGVGRPACPCDAGAGATTVVRVAAALAPEQRPLQLSRRALYPLLRYAGKPAAAGDEPLVVALPEPAACAVGGTAYLVGLRVVACDAAAPAGGNAGNARVHVYGRDGSGAFKFTVEGAAGAGVVRKAEVSYAEVLGSVVPAEAWRACEPDGDFLGNAFVCAGFPAAAGGAASAPPEVSLRLTAASGEQIASARVLFGDAARATDSLVGTKWALGTNFGRGPPPPPSGGDGFPLVLPVVVTAWFLCLGAVWLGLSRMRAVYIRRQAVEESPKAGEENGCGFTGASGSAGGSGRAAGGGMSYISLSESRLDTYTI
eukprot:Rhum_TRINITY_DN3173_c0_g1::Rhum_TRINITY_DN3173_c0_g1_i1::g.9848::m.9848